MYVVLYHIPTCGPKFMLYFDSSLYKYSSSAYQLNLRYIIEIVGLEITL